MAEVVLFEKRDGESWVSLGFNRFERIIRDGFIRLVLFTSVSVKSSVSAGDEVRISVDGSAFFHGYLKTGGRISKTAELRLEATGWGSEFARSKISLPAGVTSNVDLVTSSFSGTGLTLDTSGAVSYGVNYPGFSGRRGRLWEEMTDFYDHKLVFLPSGVVRYESTGAISSGLSYDTNSDNVVVNNWEFELDDDLLTRVDVVGNDASGNIISASSGSGDIYGRFHVGFARDVSDLQSIADSLIVTDRRDSGNIKVFWRTDVLFNEVVGLVDVTRGISGSFVVVSQKDFYPERSTILTLGSDEGANAIRRERRQSSAVEEERNTLPEDFLSSINGDTESHKHDASDFGHSHDSDVTDSNQSNSNGNSNVVSSTVRTVLAGDDFSRFVNIPDLGTYSSDMDWCIVTVSVSFSNTSPDYSLFTSRLVIRNDTRGITRFDEDFSLVDNTGLTATAIFTGSFCNGNDTIEVIYFNTSSKDVDVTLVANVSAVVKHRHSVDVGRVEEDLADVFDYNRSPSISGSADTSKSKNLLREDD